MTKIKAIIKRRPVLAYFVLAFAISWGAVLIFAGGVPVREDQLELLGVAMLLGPSVAGGVLISLVSGRSGFRDLRARLLKWRVNARWYAVALLTAPLSMAAVLRSPCSRLISFQCHPQCRRQAGLAANRYRGRACGQRLRGNRLDRLRRA